MNEYILEIGKSLENLEKNTDFQKLIEYLFGSRLLELNSLLVKDSTVNTNQRPRIMEKIIALNTIKEEFILIQNLYSSAKEQSINNTEIEEERI